MVAMVRLAVIGSIGQKKDIAPLVKNSDLLLEKANSIAPDQTAGEAGVLFGRFSRRSKGMG